MSSLHGGNHYMQVTSPEGAIRSFPLSKPCELGFRIPVIPVDERIFGSSLRFFHESICNGDSCGWGSGRSSECLRDLTERSRHRQWFSRSAPTPVIPGANLPLGAQRKLPSSAGHLESGRSFDLCAVSNCVTPEGFRQWRIWSIVFQPKEQR